MLAFSDDSGSGAVEVFYGSNFHASPETSGGWRWDWTPYESHSILVFEKPLFRFDPTPDPEFHRCESGSLPCDQLSVIGKMLLPHAIAVMRGHFWDRENSGQIIGVNKLDGVHFARIIEYLSVGSLSYEDTAIARNAVTNEHILFNDHGSGELRYVRFDQFERLAQTVSYFKNNSPQITEVLDDALADALVIAVDGQDRPFAAYIVNGDLVLARRVLAPMASLSLAPMRWGFIPDVSSHQLKPFMIHNAGDSDLEVSALRLDTDEPIDADRWNAWDCYDPQYEPLPWIIPPGESFVFCVLLGDLSL